LFDLGADTERNATNDKGTGSSKSVTNNDQSRQNITIIVQAQDYDSFRRSAPQFEAEMYKRTRRAFLKNG